MSSSAKFFQSDFEIEFADLKADLRGLVSETGITKIAIPKNSEKVLELALGAQVNVYIGVLYLQGIFLQQTIENSTYYEVRFVNMKDPQRDYLKQRIEVSGRFPGWQRRYPRIPVQEDESDLPVANLCHIRHGGQEIFVNVINFTLGGIRVETFGDNLSELKVKTEINFDLLTNTGNVINNFTGEIRNISQHERLGKDGKIITRSFGIKLLSLHPENEKKYRALIREHCQGLMKKF